PNLPENEGAVSSVLVPLATSEDGREEFLVMTKRPTTVATHKGQVCFPGGFREVTDPHLLDTALREAFEETGIQYADLEILGLLDVVRTHVGVPIYPWIGLLKYPYPFVLNPSEVDKLVLLPVKKLLSEGVKTMFVEEEGMKIKTTGIVCDGEIIWGASAR